MINLSGAKRAYNIEGQDLGGRRADVLTFAKSYRPNYHLVMGDLDMALELVDHVEEGLIYRDFDPYGEHALTENFDNYFWLTHNDPKRIVRDIADRYSGVLDKFIFTFGNNEPTTLGKTKDFLHWCVQLMHEGASAGVRLAVAEIAVAKSIWHSEVRNGVWDDFIRTLDQYRDWHIFTVHEYTTGILPATLLPDYPYNLANPLLVGKDAWGNAYMEMGEISGNYHLGRGLLVSRVRAQQIGIDPLPFVITEGSFDWMDDVDRNHNNFVSQTLRYKWNTAPFDPLRGLLGHRQYHEWVMRETNYAGTWLDFVDDQYEALIAIYPNEMRAICQFAKNRDWLIPQGHDMSTGEFDYYDQLIIARYKRQTSVQEEDEVDFSIATGWQFTAKQVTYNGNTFLNLRSSPALDGNKVGQLDAGRPYNMVVSDETLDNDGYTWRAFRWQAGETIAGWFAEIDGIVDITDPPAPDDPEPPQVDVDALKAEILEEIGATLSQHLIVDVPIPAFSMGVPVIMRQAVADHYRALAIMYTALADRIDEATL